MNLFKEKFFLRKIQNNSFKKNKNEFIQNKDSIACI